MITGNQVEVCSWCELDFLVYKEQFCLVSSVCTFTRLALVDSPPPLHGTYLHVFMHRWLCLLHGTYLYASSQYLSTVVAPLYTVHFMHYSRTVSLWCSTDRVYPQLSVEVSLHASTHLIIHYWVSCIVKVPDSCIPYLAYVTFWTQNFYGNLDL
jgi:hypothetical protein